MLYPETVKAYAKAGKEYIPTTDDIAEQEFRRKIQNSKTPVTKKISSIYRTKHEGKEYLLPYITEYCADPLGRPLDYSYLDGRYPMPVFDTDVDVNTRELKTGGLIRNDLVYKYPFEGPESVDEILAMGDVHADTKYYILSPQGTLGSFSLDEFRNRSFYELERKGITGKYPNEAEVEMQRRSEQQSANVSKRVRKTKQLDQTLAEAVAPTRVSGVRRKKTVYNPIAEEAKRLDIPKELAEAAFGKPKTEQQQQQETTIGPSLLGTTRTIAPEQTVVTTVAEEGQIQQTPKRRGRKPRQEYPQ